jgi:alkylation response protein AidB-like acyl-CoA dehydrogenase
LTDVRVRIDSLEDALAAVAGVGPVAREYAQRAEDDRTLPAEVVAAMTDAGLWRALAPKTVGGAGLAGLAEQFALVRALAYEDSSAAWGLSIGGGFGGLLGSRLSAEGREEVFADGVLPVAGAFGPNGSATSVDGGLVVSGRWQFGSGVGYAGWVLANTVLLDESGAPQPGDNGFPKIASVVVRPADITIVDDWHVAGLRGTGSMTFTMADVLVPAHRTFSLFGRPLIDEPKYQLPTMTLVGPSFAAIAVGLAQRALDEVLGVLPARVGPPPAAEPASGDSVNQRIVGQSLAAVRGALESTKSIYARYDARIAGGENLSDLALADRVELHQHTLWAAETCRGAVNELFRLGGGSAIYEPGVLQRVWRDLNVLTQHLYLRETTHTTAGKIALGLDVVAPFL